MKKILLIDGHNLLFRMFFGMPFPFYNNKNVNITGTVGFVGSVMKMIKYLNVDECLVVFDGENSRQIRNDDSYKANRQTNYEDLDENENPFSQLHFIKSVLNELGIKWIETDSIECDDYIAIISKQYAGEVYISSTDSDFFQLVNDNVKILKFRGKNSIIIDKDWIYEKYKVYPYQFALYKALIGDVVDNIKGINKVGPKTAINIINSINNSHEDKYNQIYNKNENLIKSNLSLIELPNRSIEMDQDNISDCAVDKNLLKNFKNLKFVTKITNEM